MNTTNKDNRSYLFDSPIGIKTHTESQNPNLNLNNKPIANRLATDQEFHREVQKIAYKGMCFPWINYPSTLKRKKLEVAAKIMVAERLVATENIMIENFTETRVPNYRFSPDMSEQNDRVAFYRESQKILKEYASIFPDPDKENAAFRSLHTYTFTMKTIIERDHSVFLTPLASPQNTPRPQPKISKNQALPNSKLLN